MGLHTIIRKTKRREKEMRLLMVGLDNAGKTTVVKRLSGEDISSISPTLGFSIKSMGFGKYRLNIWDVGGQKSLRAYWRNYYERTDGLVWVVDSADKFRLNDCKEELHRLLKEERLEGAALLILANKQDIDGALSVQEVAQVLDLKNIVKRNWKVLACSAVTGAGLVDGFDWIVSDVATKMFYKATYCRGTKVVKDP